MKLLYLILVHLLEGFELALGLPSVHAIFFHLVNHSRVAALHKVLRHACIVHQIMKCLLHLFEPDV